MIVRDEEDADRGAIREIVTAAFGQSEEADLVDWLRADGDSVISLVADDEGEIVGHVLFSRIKSALRALGMAPVSVLPGRQGSGIGSQLVRAGLERAAEEGWQAVFVVGEPDYYRRFGFDPATAKGFSSLYSGPYLMAVALDKPLPVSTGKIEFAPAFAKLG
jgi:putative acetyltransferase